MQPILLVVSCTLLSIFHSCSHLNDPNFSCYAAALISSGWKPGRLILICVGFGVCMALGEQMQTVFPQVSSRMFLMLPFVLALLILALRANSLRAPAALGKII